MLEKNTQAVAAAGVLVMLFCTFFWLGFFVGRSSAPQVTGALDPAPTTEQLRLNLARN